MSDPSPNVLPLTGHPIPTCDLDAPMMKTSRGDPDFAQLEYEAATKVAHDAGRPDEALAYHSLAIICSFAKNFDSISEPYQPKFRWNDRRSAIPDDLTDADLETIRQLRDKTKQPLLRSRLGDLLWIRNRDHVAAKEATADYVRAANAALNKDNWFFAVSSFQRALQLGIRLGRKSTAYLDAEASAVAALDNPLAQSEPFLAARLLGVLEKTGAGDPQRLADHAKRHAGRAAAAGDARRSRDYYELEAKFRRDAKEMEAAKAAQLAAAMTYEAEAELSVKRNPPSFFAASDSLAHGIEALRRAQADPAVIERLKGLLRQYQQESLKEMKTYTHEVDLSKPAEQAAKIVDHPDFRDALKLFVFARSLTSPEAVRAEVLKQANDFPLSQMLGASVIDQSGRVKEHIGSLLGAGSEEESAIEARMFRHAAEFLWKFRAVAYIEPARRQIWNKHVPQQSALDFLVINNPFVPPGHEGIFERGLYYGLCGDMLLSAHLLAPQLENSIRYVLEQNGVDVSNLESDLTQPVKTLGPLIALPATKEIFGPECLFELRGLLIEKLGYSFRHRVAHGFVSEGECYGAEASNLWWLTLRLCYTPLMWGTDSTQESGGGGAQSKPVA